MPGASTGVPLSVKQYVYRVLVDELGFAEDVSMARVSQVLINAGVDREAYGYSKMKPFLADMPEFLSFTDIVAGGVPQRLVSIHKRDEWASGDTAAPSGRTGAFGDSSAGGGAGSLAGSAASEVARASTDGSIEAYLQRMLSSSDYRDSSMPDGIRAELKPELDAFCHFPHTTLEVLREHVEAGTNLESLLTSDWRAAYRCGALRYYEGKVIFPLSVMREDGETPIEISIRHCTYDNVRGLPWYMCYVNTFVRPKPVNQVDSPSKEIEKFAWLGSWEAFLTQLADIALPEVWDFQDESTSRSGRKAILRSFVSTTFYRLKLEDKVAIDEKEGLAAFNTGLVDRRYDDIYACFVPSNGGIPWTFEGFCTAGSRGLGKRLVSTFNPLPEPASYFNRLDDLLYDLEKQLLVDFDHIVVDNISRLPIGFLEDELRGSSQAMELLEEVRRAADPQARSQAFSDLGEYVEEDLRLFKRLRARVNDAIDLAKRRIRWNYKTAVPSYYPRANTMSLLLPLCLLDEDVVDCALVVELMPSGNYQGQTILTMQQAYTNARLICRPDSDWLTTRQSDDEDQEY